MARKTPRPTAPHVLEMERRVVEMRRHGLRFNAIAQDLGVSPQRVGQLYRQGMARHVVADAAEIRRLEADRLDDLQFGLWEAACGGNLKAVEQVLAIMERRARLLGLDHSDKVAASLLRIEEDKVRLMAVALNAALDAIGISDAQRAEVFTVMDRELASATSEDPSPPDGPGAHLAAVEDSQVG